MPARRESELDTLEHAELISRLRWFIQLRWVFGLVLVIAGLYLAARPVGEVSGVRLALVGSVILVYNIAFWLSERWLVKHYAKAHDRHATLAAVWQIALDLIALTVVVQACGGIETPLAIFYILHMVIATLLLSRQVVFGLAALAIALFSAVAVAELREWLSHSAFFPGDEQYLIPGFVAMRLLAFGSALLMAVFLGTSIADQLRAREQDILWLERELASNVTELENANDALREAEAKNIAHFRRVSHELKAPLTAQQSLLRTLLIEIRDQGPGPRKRIERAIIRGEELLELLNDLLVLSRTRHLKPTSQRTWFDPVEEIRGVLEQESLLATEKGLRWHEEIEPTVPQILAEPIQLRTIVENIVSNAIKYTPEGGDVTFAMRSSNGKVVIEARDTGIGIGTADLARIGEEFFRTKEAQKTGSRGTGLGMTIVRSMAEAMRGELRIDSELGAGTTVSVAIPVGDSSDNPS